MSNLDKEFDSVVSEVQDKLEQAQKLLAEALALSKNNSLTLDKNQVNTLLDAVYDLPTNQNWSESDDTTGIWSSSLNYNC
jgi:hypothetical protein